MMLVAARCSPMQHVAARRNVLRPVATAYNRLPLQPAASQRSPLVRCLRTRSSLLQPRCNTATLLQRAATPLQPDATGLSTPRAICNLLRPLPPVPARPTRCNTLPVLQRLYIAAYDAATRTGHAAVAAQYSERSDLRGCGCGWYPTGYSQYPSGHSQYSGRSDLRGCG